MSVTLILLAGIVVSFAVVHVLTAQSAVQTVLASENTISNRIDPASETLVDNKSRRVSNDWNVTTVDNLSHAEEFLDCLEMKGFSERELVVMGNTCFAIRWR